MRLTYAIPLAVFLFILGLGGYMLTQGKDETIRSQMVNKPLPEFTLKPATDGVKGVTRADFTDGKPKLLNVWASWCLPCIAEAPQLEQLKQAGAEIIGVAIRDEPQNVAEFLANHGNPYSRIGSDEISSLMIDLGASGVPETYVIDGKGNIRYQHIGDIRKEHVPILLELLEQAR
jgi:cytochrome c biogenesis protein CcmG/thiol:disulfide interchange protein DsbE